MTQTRSRRGVALVLALILLALAAGLLAILGLSVKQLVQLDRLESDRVVLRQMIDSGAAWANRHVADWPRTDGQLECPRLPAEDIVSSPCRGFITLRLASNEDGHIKHVVVEARLLRPRGRELSRTATITFNHP